MAIARSLVVDIAMNTAKITKDIEKIRGKFDTLGSAANKLGGVLIAAFSVRAIIGYTDKIIDLGDELNKTSQKVGISVEKLSAFEYSARLSGNTTDELRGALSRLSANMQDAAINKTSEAARTFKALGVEVTDAQGKLKDTGTVFEQLSGRFAAAADGPNKTAAAINFMGRSGAELIPLLNNLRETADEAERTGNIISKDFAEASERFNDSVERTSSAFANLARVGIANVLPLLNQYIEKLNVAIGAQDGLSLSALGFEKARLANAYFQAAEGARMWGGDVESATESIRRQIDAIDEQIIAMNKAQGTATPKGKPQLNLPEIEKKAASGKVSDTSGAEDAIRAEMEISEGLTKEGITRQTELMLAAEEERRMLKLEAIRRSILDEDALRLEESEKRLEDVQAAFEAEIINMEDRNKLIQQIELEHQAKMGDIQAQAVLDGQKFLALSNADKIKNVIATGEAMTASVATSSRGLFAINKAFALANAAVSLPSAVLQSFEKGGGYPWGLIPAGLMLVKGLAQIQAIRSASFGSATSAPSVGGGGAMPVTNVDAASQPSLRPEVQRASQDITINIENGIGDKTYWQELIDDVIVPGINDASERNVNLTIRTN